MIAVRWEFVVNRFVFIPLGGQDAGEGVGDLVYEARQVLNGEVELGQSESPTHQAASRIGNLHQPAEGVVFRPYGERESFDIRAQRRDAPYDGVTFAFGCRIVPFSVGWRFRPVSNGDPVVRFVFVLLLGQRGAELIR